MKILIVDDNQDARMILKKTLESDGYDVDEASNGEMALIRAKTSCPDMIISDILMPVMDGFQLCRRVKGDDTLNSILFVFYTATYTDSKDEEFARSLGAERFIRKPMEPEVFIGMLREAIEQHKTGQLVVKRKAAAEETVYLKLYNEALIRKLEDKMAQLEEANKVLEQVITDRKLADEALRESEERYRFLFDAVPVGIGMTDLEGTVHAANRSIQEITGYTLEEFKTVKIGDTYVDLDERRQMLQVLGESGQVRDYEVRLRRKDGTVYPALLNIDQVEHEGRKVFLTAVRDITKRKRTEEALRSEKAFAESLITTAQAIILVLDKEGRIIRFNPYMEEISGYKVKEVQGKDWFSTFLPSGDHRRIRELFMRSVSGIQVRGNINKIITKDRREIEVEWYDKSLKDDLGNVIGLLAVGQDVTERKLAEEQIKSSLEEKKVLLREIHHRVKNNMQVIISLLRLQAEKIGEKRYSDMFKETRDRIKTMALIHERLYQAKDFTHVNFDEYVESIVNGLFRSNGVNTDQIIFRIKVQDVSLGLENAIPCGLIINELVSNSLKHAFPRGRKGEIRISLRSIGMDEIELIVGDDGAGIPEDLDIEKTGSLGLHLVSILAEHQLGGKIDLNREGGTEYRILFRRRTDNRRTLNNGKSAHFDSGR